VTYALTAVLALAPGWCWGHSTARIRHVPIGAAWAQDDAALAVEHDPATCTRKDHRA
jgi:hypothetical protein